MSPVCGAAVVDPFRQRPIEDVDEESAADIGERRTQFVRGRVPPDRHPFLGIDAARVEALLEAHHVDPGFGVAREDRPLDRGRTAPPWQQRVVQVDHRQRREQMRLDDASVRHHDTELGTVVDGRQHVVGIVGDREAELERRGLDRARRQRTASPPLLVDPGDHADDVVAGVDERSQRRDRHVRRAEVDQLHAISSSGGGA